MDNLAHSSLVTMCVAMATMALMLMFFQSVAFQEDRDLSRSRRYLVYVFIAMAANCYVHDAFELRVVRPSLGIAFDITTYFLVSILMCFAYFPILDQEYRHSKSRRFLLISWGITTACLWVAALFTYGIASKVLLIIGGVLCLTSFLRVLADFIGCYRKVANLITDVTLTNVESFTRFVYRSVIVVSITGLAAIVVVLLRDPEWQSYFNYFSTFMFFYLGMSFVNYVTSLK